MEPKITQTFRDLHDQVTPFPVQINGGLGSPLAVLDLNPAPVAESPPEVPQAVAAAPEKKPLKVAIVGTAPSSRLLAPFADPSWEIWVCSPGNMNTVPRVTRWFEAHANLEWPENISYGKPYLDWLRQQTFPVYMQDKSQVPNAIPIPKDELVSEFGPYFFTSSFSWMMALALKEGATDIGLFGVDMASKDEYILQRSGGHYFIQLATKRGVNIHLPLESDLAQPPGLYGFDSATPFGRKLLARQQELNQRVAAMTQQRDQLNTQVTYLQGALEDVQYMIQIWSGAQQHPR